jgi:hypothetical protein
MDDLRELLAEALYHSQCNAFARDNGFDLKQLPQWSEAGHKGHLEWADDAIATIKRAGYQIVKSETEGGKMEQLTSSSTATSPSPASERKIE